MGLKLFFELRGVLWLVVGVLLVFGSAPVAWGVWLLVTVFLSSGVLLLVLPPSWSQRSRVGYAVFFADMGGLTILFRSVSGFGSELLLLYYLTVFTVTAGEDLRASVMGAGVAAALYVWLHRSQTEGFVTGTTTFFHISLFFAAAVSCGYLAQQTRAQKSKMQKQTEEAVHSSEERYRVLFHSNPQPMWLYDLEALAFLDVNESAQKQYGYSREEFLRLNINDICPPEDQLPLEKTVSLTSKVKKRASVRRHQKKDGTIIDVEIASCPLTFAGKRAELVVAADITERTLAEEKLRTTNQTLQTLIQASPLAIITLDLEGYVRSWNAAAERIFGWNEVEVLGRPLLIVAEDQQRQVRELHARLLKGEQLAGLELTGKRKDGLVIDVVLSASPLYDAEGNIYAIESLVADVSQHKQLQEQFRQAQKMEAVGRLAGGVAHDFNNLLTIITGYSELLLDRLRSADSLHGYAEEIKKAGERAASLTRQLLAFSRKQVLTLQVLDLNAVVANTEKMLRRLIGEDIELDLVKGEELGRVKADAGQLEQIIMNLAVNSRDAMPQGGTLTLETANVTLDETYARSRIEVAPGPYVMLAVSDTGVGMDAKTQSRLFEPFFTTKEPGTGTGLGLATVYGIVKQSGGHISVYSKPGSGTTFKIYLPALRRGNRRKEDSPTHPRRLPRGTETILLVEDEDGVRSLAREILEEQGYRVLEASHPKEALTVSKRHRGSIHLLLADVVMPEMSGRELAEQLVYRFSESYL